MQLPVFPAQTHTRLASAPHLDRKGLQAELRAAVAGEVRFDDGSLALYSTDASNYRHIPIGVVLPRSVDDVAATVAICRRHDVPLLSRGGGTSLAGQCCNVAVVMDFSKYLNSILELDTGRRFARVQPGVVLDELRSAAEKHHLTFAPDPATHSRCTLGGMIGNNSCGAHSVMAGKTVENVEELEILTHDGCRMHVGQTTDAQLARIIAAGGRRGAIYAGLRSLRDSYAEQIRKRFPRIPRRVSGYNLDQLLPENGFHVARALVGSEGTCVTVLEAKVRLVYSPPFRSLLVLGYADAYTAADHVMELLALEPLALEGFDDLLVNAMRKKNYRVKNLELLPEGRGWLLIEFGGDTQAQADERARVAMRRIHRQRKASSAKLYSTREEQTLVWEVRESGLGGTAHVPGENIAWEGWEDSAVPPESFGAYLRDLRKLLDRYGYACSFYGHFGQGCLHTRIDFDLTTARGVAKFRSFIESAADLVLHYGGSFSGEHGDGQARAELLPKMFGPELMQAFRNFKAVWDPDGRMNPGKLVDARRFDEDLRLGAGYDPWRPQTHFRFPDDHGSFAEAMLRCVGVGTCRRHSGGTMCPSYMVTREEKHSTRGRARLLFEMLQTARPPLAAMAPPSVRDPTPERRRSGDPVDRLPLWVGWQQRRPAPVQDGWRDESIKDALDLCLSCKGCKAECPVNVDMATYKAEFLSHYFERRLRPVSAYSMGLIRWWARLGSRVPDLANYFTQTPGLRTLAKAAAGIAHQRDIPPFARQSFKQWFNRRKLANAGGPEVLLWPDTFNNYFYPHTAMAGVEVLETAGFRVRIPQQELCCGRPLYDYGMLSRAKSWLREIMQSLAGDIERGIPIVALEPSCAAVFRDELRSLFPDDTLARKLSAQTLLLSEFLAEKAPAFHPPGLNRRAVVHAHCHHKSVLKTEAEENLLAGMKLDFKKQDYGCCGMAGSFGFEASHYEVSVKVGQHALLPAVSSASPDTIIIAGGFSCREQIEQCTDRRALHPAEVIRMAIRDNGGRTNERGGYPEDTQLPPKTTVPWPKKILYSAVLGGCAALLIATALRQRRKSE